LQYIIGDGDNYYDFTYVENVAYGHVCADKTLSSEDGAKRAAGKVRPMPNNLLLRFHVMIYDPFPDILHNKCGAHKILGVHVIDSRRSWISKVFTSIIFFK
jgi:nucleoside-diphosphate-sugar epimerase